MQLVQLIRLQTSDQGTFGVLRMHGLQLFSGELPWLNNMRKISSIPAGEYNISMVRSPKFGRVYEVKDVLNRSHVLIHPANFMGDSVTWDTQLQGCIALGFRRVRMANKSGKQQLALGVSRSAVEAFQNALSGKPAVLKIEERYSL
jgi:Family of unknown function (DUF5675)